MERRASVFKCESLGVVSSSGDRQCDGSSMIRPRSVCQNYVNNSRHRHQKSTPFTEMIKESNFSSSFFLFLLSSFQKEKKKRQLLSGGMQERPNWSQPGYDRHLCFSCRMLIGGLSAILRKRKDSKKKKINIKNKKKNSTIEGENFKTNRKKERKCTCSELGNFVAKDVGLAKLSWLV